MFTEVTYYPILGIPLIVYGGLATMLLILFAGAIGFGTRTGRFNVSVEWHYRIAYVAIAAGLMHALLGILAHL